jgi:hypothetical protein
MNKLSINQFEELLKNHDWSYQMSEDSRYYRRGQMQLKEIESAIAEGGESFQNLYNEYRNKFGV